MHDLLGDYTAVFLSAGLLGFIAAGMTLRISVAGRTAVPPPFSPPVAPVGAA